MANIFFQGAEVAMSSGTSAGTFALIQRAQDLKVDAQPPRTEQRVFGRFKPLNDRIVVNYTPVNMSLGWQMGNKDVERNLGILNSTGVLVQIGQGTEVTNWGARSFQIYNAPVTTQSYAGQYEVVSGVLKSYSLRGSVGDVVKANMSVEALDLRQSANNSARTIPSYDSQAVKPQSATITGINFTGLGYSGLLIQSFDANLSINHAATQVFGKQFPERRIVDGVFSLQMTAFVEGFTNTVTTLNDYACGTFITGLYVFSLQPTCASSEPPMTITMAYPYLESQSMGVQIGNYTQVELSFVCPLSIVPFEATGANMGSNVTIT